MRYLSKNNKIDTTCEQLGYGIDSVMLIENLNQIVPDNKVINIKKDMLGIFSYIQNLDLKQVIYRCILKNIPINTLFMSCVNNCPDTKILINKWIDKKFSYDNIDIISSKKKLIDLDSKTIRKIVILIDFYKDKPFHNWISIGMGLNYSYKNLKKIDNARKLMHLLLKDEITVEELFVVISRLNFFVLKNLIKKLNL